MMFAIIFSMMINLRIYMWGSSFVWEVLLLGQFIILTIIAGVFL